MSGVSIKIINRSENPLPQYATPGSSGMDIRASLESDITLLPLQRDIIPTGLFLEMQHGYEAQIRPRSGMAIKNGITCLNTPGTIDSDYRGEIKVILINLGNEDYTIKSGDRIAQMVFAKIEHVNLEESPQLTESSRGEGGFGHTGHQ